MLEGYVRNKASQKALERTGFTIEGLLENQLS
jgi:RimJ/RimL family protein N-acetyltransferase